MQQPPILSEANQSSFRLFCALEVLMLILYHVTLLQKAQLSRKTRSTMDLLLLTCLNHENIKAFNGCEKNLIDFALVNDIFVTSHHLSHDHLAAGVLALAVFIYIYNPNS